MCLTWKSKQQVSKMVRAAEKAYKKRKEDEDKGKSAEATDEESTDNPAENWPRIRSASNVPCLGKTEQQNKHIVVAVVPAFLFKFESPEGLLMATWKPRNANPLGALANRTKSVASNPFPAFGARVFLYDTLTRVVAGALFACATALGPRGPFTLQEVGVAAAPEVEQSDDGAA
eukprot:2598635-Amphidinium_carterae.1